jgi:hypothetical protein
MSDAVFTTEAQLLRGKIEAVAGTAETLADPDGDVRVRNIAWGDDAPEWDNESAKYKTGDHTHDEAIAGVRNGSITGDLKLAAGEIHYDNSGTDTITDRRYPYEKYLNAGGLITTVTDPTDELTEDGLLTAVPGVDGDIQTMTAGLTEIQSGSAGVATEGRIAGAMATWTLGADGVGAPFMFNFELQGKVNGVSDITVPVFSDANALSTTGFQFLDTSITVEEMNQDGSDAGNTPITFCSENVGLDPQNTVATVPCQSDPTGIKYKMVSTRDPRFTFKPQFKSTADFDYYSGMTGMNIYKIVVTHTNSKNGATLTITIPRAQLIGAPRSDTDGIVHQDATFRPLRNVQGATDAEKEQDYKIEIGAVNVIAV